MKKRLDDERKENMKLKQRLEADWKELKTDYDCAFRVKKGIQDEIVAERKEVHFLKERNAWCEHKIEASQRNVFEFQNVARGV